MFGAHGSSQMQLLTLLQVAGRIFLSSLWLDIQVMVLTSVRPIAAANLHFVVSCWAQPCWPTAGVNYESKYTFSLWNGWITEWGCIMRNCVTACKETFFCNKVEFVFSHCMHSLVQMTLDFGFNMKHSNCRWSRVREQRTRHLFLNSKHASDLVFLFYFLHSACVMLILNRRVSIHLYCVVLRQGFHVAVSILPPLMYIQDHWLRFSNSLFKWENVQVEVEH